jgi:outer membrane protein assembly factor BamB
LKCLELASDRNVKWVQKGFGYTDSIILVCDKLVVLCDSGEVVVAEAKPDAYKELVRFRAIAGKCWSTPAFSNSRLYIRSGKEGACYDMSTK